MIWDPVNGMYISIEQLLCEVILDNMSDKSIDELLYILEGK